MPFAQRDQDVRIALARVPERLGEKRHAWLDAGVEKPVLHQRRGQFNGPLHILQAVPPFSPLLLSQKGSLTDESLKRLNDTLDGLNRERYGLAESPTAGPPCKADADCGDGKTCSDGHCAGAAPAAGPGQPAAVIFSGGEQRATAAGTGAGCGDG